MRLVLLLTILALPGHALDGPHVVFVIGESEYDTATTLPDFAAAELETRGVRTTFVFADENRFPGIEAIESADLVVLSVRRRTPPRDQLELIRAYLRRGKPLLALRTSSHAFALRSSAPPEGHVDWPTFDVEVLGGRYENHYDNRQGTDVYIRPEAGVHPILADVKHPSFRSGGTLYRSRDLEASTFVLLEGRTIVDGETVDEPVAWTHAYGDSRIFYTSLGHASDFAQAPFRQLLFNAIFWAMERTPPLPDRLDPDVAKFLEDYVGQGALGGSSGYRTPEETVRSLRPAGDIAVDLVAAEPAIYQPVDINFDHRGRLWVVQYNQYPDPQGLTSIGVDQYLRTRYDTIPQPPPGHKLGADRITVLTDEDGDGRFERTHDAITGLNIATSVLVGRGGIWVLSPPYLLFYPDADDDAVPDGPPEVHLRGFGLEDTHAVANSLTWGPDGWIYGAQGSTTTANVTSARTKGVRFQGQAIWRYHPAHQVFEIFAEGGGNTFHVTFDAVGRLFSGHNGDVARAFHYKQGAYYRKNWGKHGALSNPYAFGYFAWMGHEGEAARFTHAEIIYEGGAMPSRYDGAMISLNPLQRYIIVSRLEPQGSTFRTVDTHRLVDTDDAWFRPVDVRVGPDGAVYVADWYDERLSHADPRDTWHRASGRIYRFRGVDFAPVGAFDLSALSTDELIDQLGHPNRWHRFEALRVLGDRKDGSAVPRLRRIIREHSGRPSLDALWALNLSGGFTEAFAEGALEHDNPHMRLWTVRLLGDSRSVSSRLAEALAWLSAQESNAEVRSQLAASAARLPSEAALPILDALLRRAEDADDPHIPLQLWWAVEAHATAALALLEDATLWESPILRGHVAGRLMMRFVHAGDLDPAARLMGLAPDEPASGVLADAFLEALRTSDVDATALPPALSDALERHESRIGESPLVLGVRRGERQRSREALAVIADPNADTPQRVALIDLMGEVVSQEAATVLLDVLKENPAIQRAALRALAVHDSPEVGERIVALYPDVLRADSLVRLTALETVAARPSWTQQLIDAIESGKVDAGEIPPHVVDRIRLHAEVDSIWPVEAQEGWTPVEIVRIVESAEGDADRGLEIYAASCGSCHRLFGTGGSIGPDLTGYDRQNTFDIALNTVHPHVHIREGYVQYALRTVDGRSLVGMIVDRSAGGVTLRLPAGAETTHSSGSIAELRALDRSLMPAGLLDPLSESQIRDLFAYLQTSAPPR